MLHVRYAKGPSTILAVGFPYLSAANAGGNEFFPSLSSGLDIINHPNSGLSDFYVRDGVIIGLGASSINSFNPLLSANQALSAREGEVIEKFCAHWGVDGEIEILPEEFNFNQSYGELLTIGRFQNLEIPKFTMAPNGVLQAPPNGRVPYLNSGNNGLGCWGSWGPYRSCRISAFQHAERVVYEDSFGTDRGTRNFSRWQTVDSNIRSFSGKSTYSNCSWTLVNSAGYEWQYDVKAELLGIRPYNSVYLKADWRVTIVRRNYKMNGAGGSGAALWYVDTTTWVKELTQNALIIGYSPGSVVKQWEVDNVLAFAHKSLQSVAPGRSSSAFGDALDKALPVLTSNHLENAKQFGDVLKSVPNLMRSVKEFLPTLRSQTVQSAKAFAGRFLKAVKADSWAPIKAFGLIGKAYLLYRFVYKPTVKDVAEFYTKADPIFEKMGTIVEGIGRGRDTASNVVAGTTIDWVIREKVSVTSDGAVPYEALRRLGLNPSPSNLWDLIPLSFLVDYVIGVSSLLKSLEQQFLPGITVRVGCASVKSNKIDLIGLPGVMGFPHRFRGSCKVWFYQRVITFGAPSFKLELNGRPACQWWQVGVALLATSLDVSPTQPIPRPPLIRMLRN